MTDGRLRGPREFGGAVATIMVKELRSRMRGRRAFIVLTIYLALLAAITYAVYLLSFQSAQNDARMAGQFGGAATNASAQVGRWIFTGLSYLQILLVCFIAPAFTSGAISLEREKQTLDLLVSTPLRPAGIVVGKLLAALAFVFLMILSSVPLTAIVLMYGGASVEDIVRQQVVLLSAAIGFGAIGLFFSALIKRTQMATVLTYATVLLLTLGTAFLYIFWTAMIQLNSNGFFPNRRAPEAILYPNPFVAMTDVVAYTDDPNSGGMRFMLLQLRGIDPFGGGNFGAVPGPMPLGVECRVMPDGAEICNEVIDPMAFPQPAVVADAPVEAAGYFWPRFVASFGVLALGLTLLSTRLVVPAGMRFVFRRRRRRSPPAGDELLGAERRPTIEAGP